MPKTPKPKFELLSIGIEVLSWDAYYGFGHHTLSKDEIEYGEYENIHQRDFNISLKGRFNFVSSDEKKIKGGTETEISIHTKSDYHFEYERKESLKTNDERDAYVGGLFKNGKRYISVLYIRECDIQKIMTLISSGKVKEVDMAYSQSAGSGYTVKNFLLKTFKDEEE